MSDPRLAEIRARLEKALAPKDLHLTDDADQHLGHAGHGHGHFSVVIVADVFTGKTPVARHRLVYAALSDMTDRIHALAIQALSPDEL